MIGIVVAIDEVGCKVRVEFRDRDDGDGNYLVSDWLPVGQRKCLGDQDYWLPDEGTQVVCLMDEFYESGVVVCAIYSDEDPPPISSKDKFYRRFKDGTFFEYDRATHKLSASVQGSIEVTASGSITSTAPIWTHNGKLVVTQDIESQANIKATGDVLDQGGAKSMAGMRTVYNSEHPPPKGQM